MIIATLLVKNEEDIIDEFMKFHFENGVDKMIVTDNNSSDKTKEIISSYPEVLEIIDEPANDYRQGDWVTRMARLACKFEPTWIVHLDADEFWHGLKNVYKMNHAIVYVNRFYEHPPLTDNFKTTKDMAYYYRRPCDRLIHKPAENIIVNQGNHSVLNIEGTTGHTDEIFIHHYSIRSYNQFIRKAKQAECYNNYPGDPEHGFHWREYYNLYKSGNLKEYYDKKIPDKNQLKTMQKLCPIFL